MSKPMLVTLPFVMLLLDYWPLEGLQDCKLRFKRRASRTFNLHLQPSTDREMAVFFARGAFFHDHFLAQRNAAVASLAKVPLTLRLENAILAYADLSVENNLAGASGGVLSAAQTHRLAAHDHCGGGFDSPSPPWPGWNAGAIPGCSSAGFGFWERWCRSSAWYRWAIRPGPIVTVISRSSGFLSRLPLPLPNGRTGFAGCKLACAVAGVLILSACLVLTENQLRYWHDSESLFTHALAVTKDNALAHLNLGVALQEQRAPRSRWFNTRKSCGSIPPATRCTIILAAF